jgi:2-keto-4-pentenoate hydratase
MASPGRLSVALGDAALRTQLDLQGIWESCGESVGGWKVGFTSSDPRTPGDNRDQFEPDYRPFGFVLAKRILPTGSSVPRNSIQVCHVEPELCVVMGASLGGAEVTPEQARRSVSGIAPAFEINEVRYANKLTPLPVRIASGLSNWGMVVGDPIEPPDWDVRSTTVTVRRDGVEVSSVTLPDGAIDDVFTSISRLCHRLDVFDRSLRDGDRILTGAFSHHAVGSDESWSASFSGLGDVAVTFTAA